MRGNQVALHNKCPDRLWDIKGGSGVYKVTDMSTVRRNGYARYKPGLDIDVVFGNWCDEIILLINPRKFVFAEFQKGWESKQAEIGAGTQLSLF